PAPARDPRRVGRLGHGTPRAHLSSHGQRPRAAGGRALTVGTAVGSDGRSHAAAGAGESVSLFDWLPWRRSRLTGDLSDELRAHLEMAARDRIARGESPMDAAAHARQEFGNPGLVQEIARDEWGGAGRVIEHLAQDIRFACRMLRRAPAFATIVIVTMALSIGATTA